VKIHTDVLTIDDLHRACYAPFWCEPVAVGSRKRDHGFEVRLGAPNLPGRRFRNSGQHGRDNVYAATYHEHGWWMMTLFELDPRAIIGQYDGVEDFHVQTAQQFVREAQIEILRDQLRRSLSALNDTLEASAA